MFEIYGPPLKYSIPPTNFIINTICTHLKGSPDISAEIIDPPVYIILALTCCIQLTIPVSIRNSDKYNVVLTFAGKKSMWLLWKMPRLHVAGNQRSEIFSTSRFSYMLLTPCIHRF